MDTVRFPPGKAGNLLRGAFGTFLRETADPAVYRQVFEPGKALGSSPSGLADWPRPFIFRTAGLDGLAIPAGARFTIDMHLFDLRSPLLESFTGALGKLATAGLGPGRGRAELEGVDELDLEDRAATAPSAIDFEPVENAVSRVHLRFLTPTELKVEGRIAERPEFPVLFARLRDRISTLRMLYGEGAPEIDFRLLGERASAVRLERCDLVWERVERKSSRTGQVHWLGGFTGDAEYAGELAEFLPWLRAARWTGVGRQTVWGKGDVRVIP